MYHSSLTQMLFFPVVIVCCLWEAWEKFSVILTKGSHFLICLILLNVGRGDAQIVPTEILLENIWIAISFMWVQIQDLAASQAPGSRVSALPPRRHLHSAIALPRTSFHQWYTLHFYHPQGFSLTLACTAELSQLQENLCHSFQLSGITWHPVWLRCRQRLTKSREKLLNSKCLVPKTQQSDCFLH